jgi:SAM-dependent methyltransferase
MHMPGLPIPADVWASGQAYEPFIGRWSRRVAPLFLDWLAVAPGGHWLDVGCGTGALSAAILAQAAPRAVSGLDRAPGFVAYARQQTPDPRARFAAADAQALPLAEASADAAVAALVLNFLPRPEQAAAGMARAVRPGGTVAAYVWDYAAGMQLLRAFWDTATALDPAAAALDEGARFPLCAPGPLHAALAAAGLRQVAVRALDIPTVFRDFDDYWQPFLGGQGPAPTYVQGLGPAQQAALRERLRATLPFAPDGTLALTARAWAVRGRRG